MAFDDVRLLDSVEKGAVGGPSFSTTVATLGNGYEQRNQNWSLARATYDIGYGIDSAEVYGEVLAFFYARAGMARSFRFRDWGDYTIGDDETSTPDFIGIGDGSDATWQIIKQYTSGSQTYTRNITKIVASTLRVFVNGVEKTLTTHYTFNALTGLITFTGGNIPAFGESIGVICEFDVPVRFDSDAIAVSMETFEAGSVPNIALREVLGE